MLKHTRTPPVHFAGNVLAIKFPSSIRTGSFRRSEIGGMDPVEIVDPLTVKIILKTPVARSWNSSPIVQG